MAFRKDGRLGAGDGKEVSLGSFRIQNGSSDLTDTEPGLQSASAHHSGAGQASAPRLKNLFRKSDGAEKAPLDPLKQAAIRRSLVWLGLSYVPLIGGCAWAIFAFGHWAGSRGPLLAGSGLLIGLAASSALFFPFLRAVAKPNRRLLGMSIATYTLVSVLAGIALAAVLAVIAIAAHVGSSAT